MKVNLWIVAAALLALIQLALIGAKVAGPLHLAWGWVLAPIWLPVVAFFVVALIIIALIGGSSSSGDNPFR
jgi:quinol-cytochrome oxidoreductase complex cytochrome b subunit